MGSGYCLAASDMRSSSGRAPTATPTAHVLPTPAGSEVVWESLVPDEACPPFDFPKVSPLMRGKQHRHVGGGDACGACCGAWMA